VEEGKLLSTKGDALQKRKLENWWQKTQIFAVGKAHGRKTDF